MLLLVDTLYATFIFVQVVTFYVVFPPSKVTVCAKPNSASNITCDPFDTYCNHHRLSLGNHRKPVHKNLEPHFCPILNGISISSIRKASHPLPFCL